MALLINELKIGNKFECMGMIQTVSEIWDNTNGGQIIQEGYEYIIRCLENGNQYKPIEINPIPLTEECLLKFGFKSLFSGAGYVKNRTEIGCNHNGFYIIASGLKIEFVHQLQNLYFALTGGELC